MKHSPNQHVLSTPIQLGTITSGGLTAVDCRGYSVVQFDMTITTAGGATFDAIVEESDTGVGAWTTVPNSAIAQVPASQTLAKRRVSVNSKAKRKRYLRVNPTVVGTVTSSVNALQYDPERLPITPVGSDVSIP